MRILAAIFILSLMGTPTAFGCPEWWATYKPHLAFFGVDSAWAGTDPQALSIKETLQGWRELTGLEDSEALKALVYKATLGEITALRASAQGGPASELARKNSAAAALVEGGRLDILDYLLFLRQSESGFKSPDSWEYRRNGPPDKETLRTLSHSVVVFAKAEAAAHADLPEALKRRYIYQMFKFGFSEDNHERHDQLKELFTGEVASWSDDEPIKEWCRSYYAGLLYRDGDLTGAFKEYAQVYAHSLRCRDRAHESLHLILHDQADAGLKTLERTDLTTRERKAVQQVLNSFNPDLEATLAASLEKGWPLPPDANHRLTGFLNAENDRRLANLAPPVPEVQSRLEKRLVAAAATQDDPAPWYLGAANLAILRGDAAEARHLLRRADRADPAGRHQAQLIVLQALNRAYLEPLDRRGEARLLNHLSWLIENSQRYQRLRPDGPGVSPPPDDADRLDVALDGLLGTILPDRYTRQGRDDRAALILAAWSANPADAQAYASAF